VFVPRAFSISVKIYRHACESFTVDFLLYPHHFQRILRVIRYQQVYLSTFEEDSAKDPTGIQKVSASDDKDDNLFPSQLPPLPGTEHNFVPLAESLRKKRYGYPICWSRLNYEWYPFLPAVVDFNYPIFRGMSRQPDIVHDKSGYRLNDEQMALWQNVEFVMLTVSKAAGSRQLVSLDHREPEPPSSFGYTRGHTQLKFAQKCALKSLNAFQRLLGYCAYSISGCTSLQPLSPHAAFYSDRGISELYQKLNPNNPDVHILAKLLLSTLWKMRFSGNHTGVVLAYDDDYDYSAVVRMFENRVPVYVAWPGPDANPYTRFSQHHRLEKFQPKREHFEALQSPPAPQPEAVSTLPTIHYGVPPAPKDKRTYDHPADYVRKRLQEIPEELERSPDKQSMLSRLKSAANLSNLGSAKFFQFEPTTIIDEQTGREKRCWTRILLTKSEAMDMFEAIEGSNVWYVQSVPSPLRP